MYTDNGKGYEINNSKNSTLGLRLIKMLAEEIKANLTVKNGLGLTYTFKFETQVS